MVTIKPADLRKLLTRAASAGAVNSSEVSALVLTIADRRRRTAARGRLNEVAQQVAAHSEQGEDTTDLIDRIVGKWADRDRRAAAQPIG